MLLSDIVSHVGTKNDPTDSTTPDSPFPLGAIGGIVVGEVYIRVYIPTYVPAVSKLYLCTGQVYCTQVVKCSYICMYMCKYVSTHPQYKLWFVAVLTLSNFQQYSITSVY